MQVSNDVKFEYLNNQGTVTAPKEEVAKIGNALNGSTTSVEQSQSTSNIDKLIEKICAEFSKLGLTPEQIKQSNIIAEVSGMNEAQIKNASEQDLNRIFESIKTAIKDSTVNGQVNLEKAIKLAKTYHTALIGEWESIDSFKKSNRRNSEDISARMERFFGLDKGSFANLPQEKVEKYLERYFKDFFLEKVKKSNNPQKVYKEQIQDFTKLLANTPDEQKAVFRQAIVSLQASKRLKGLDAVLKSFETQQARTEWADGCDTKFTKAFATKADCEGNVPNKNDVTAAVSKLTEQKSEEGIKKHQEDLQKEAVEFFNNNKDALAIIKAKEEKGEPLTDAEKELVLIRDNYFTAAKAGEITGTALNQIIDSSVKENLLDKMNRDAYELPIYKEVISQVTEFVKNNPDALALSEEELTKVLDKATNGNYSAIIKDGEAADIKAPVITTIEKADATSSDGIGLNNTSQTQIQQIIERKENNQKQIAQNSDDNKATKFEVETPKKSEVTSFAQAKQLSGSFTNVIKDFKNYGDKVVAEAAKTVARFGKSAQVYFGNLGGYNFITAIGKENNGWDTDQISKLNLSFAQRKILTEQAKEKEEKTARA